jgi:putative endonuclease
MSLLNKRTEKRLIGDCLEEKAVSYLCSLGLKIIAQNYLCKMGEVDIIAREESTLVFIEVRYRKDNHFGGSAFSVNLRKQKRIAKAAAHYLQSHRLTNKIACRFDVMAIEGKIAFEQTLTSSQLNWIKGAFDANP